MFSGMQYFVQQATSDRIVDRDPVRGLQASLVKKFSIPTDGNPWRSVLATNDLSTLPGTVLPGGSTTGLRTDPTLDYSDFNNKTVIYQIIAEARNFVNRDPHVVDKTIREIAGYAVWQKWNYLFIRGDSNADPSQFDGIDTWLSSGLLPATQTVTAVAGLSIGLVLDAIDRLSYNGSVKTVLIARKEGIRALAALQVANGVSLDYKVDPLIGRCLHFAGIPIIRDEHIAMGGAPEYYTTIYCAALGQMGVFFCYPRSQEGTGVVGHREYRLDTDSWLYTSQLTLTPAFSSAAVSRITNVDVSQYIDQ